MTLMTDNRVTVRSLSAPSTPRLRMEPTASRGIALDGGWWSPARLTPSQSCPVSSSLSTKAQIRYPHDWLPIASLTAVGGRNAGRDVAHAVNTHGVGRARDAGRAAGDDDDTIADLTAADAEQLLLDLSDHLVGVLDL